MDSVEAEALATAELRSILASEAFQAVAVRRAWDVWREQLESWVLDRLTEWWISIMAAASGREGLLGYAILLASSIAIASLLVMVIRAVRLSVTRDAAHAYRATIARRERSDRFWREAQELATAGRFEEATRALYLSALYALEEHALLKFQETLTNREHADRLAREHPELKDVVGPLVVSYDRHRYGSYPVTNQTYAEMRGLVERARSASL
jgi:hypothetical protein